jgi:hypothetical protein
MVPITSPKIAPAIFDVLKIVKMFSLASYLRAKNSLTGLVDALLVIGSTLVTFAGLEATDFVDFAVFLAEDLAIVLAFVVAI